MKIKYVVILLFIISILFKNYALADDEIENMNTDEIKEVLQTSNDVTKEPIINSRAAVIYDRTTKNIIWGKEENTKRPMASTTNVISYQR